MTKNVFVRRGAGSAIASGLMVAGLLASLLALGFDPAANASAAPAAVGCGDSNLIAAIEAANATPGDDTLDLQAGCTYVLAAANNTTLGANGLPVINDAAAAGKLTIHGHGAKIVRGYRLWLPLIISAPAAQVGGASNGGAELKRVSDDPSLDFRILAIVEGGSLTLDSLTLANGALPDNNGGGIYNAGTLVISNTTLSGNSANFGGGIYNTGRMTITESALTDNSASGAGGAINSLGDLTVNGSTFAGNDASLGDSILIADGSSTISGSTIPAGTTFTCPTFPVLVAAGDTTGLVDAIHCANSSPGDETISLTNSTYSLTAADNSVVGPTGLPIIVDAATAGMLSIHGGGAAIVRSPAGGTPEFRLMAIDVGGQLALDNLTLQNGRLSNHVGGGIFSQGALQVTNAHVVSNTAFIGGGIMNAGLAANPGTVAISATTFASNTASSAGGGLFSAVGVVTLTNSSFISNTAGADGGGFSNEAGATVSGSTFSDNWAAFG
ncbi:MAG: hypothetical protein ABI847_14795, partial [Anaerolineales bacterium]